MLDLEQHLLRQMAFSRATFGPGTRTDGVIDHIRKELKEVEKSNGDVSEWCDVVILALDGLSRQLLFAGAKNSWSPQAAAETACKLIVQKQSINEARNWPDWRTADPHRAIEHIRSEAANV